jgi:hypothetical protein
MYNTVKLFPIVTFILFVFLMASCAESVKNETKEPIKEETEDTTIVSNKLFDKVGSVDSTWMVESHYTSDEIDTLLVDFVSYIFKKPSVATWETKLNPEYRKYYINNTDRFEIVYYSIKDNVHYYYLLRPARNEDGYQQRGVGGVFKRNEANKIVEFEELFNTNIMSSDSLKNVGYHLFSELISTGTVETLIKDTTIIEWPDGSLFYSKEKNEWRYVD